MSALAGCGCMDEFHKWFREHPVINPDDWELPEKIKIPTVTFKGTCKECGTSGWMEINFEKK